MTKKNRNSVVKMGGAMNTNKITYLVIAILVLFLSVTSATYSYFMATATNNSITGNMADIKLELDIKKVSTADDTSGGIIPMSNNMVEVAINNNCIDNNGNAVCQIYKTTIKNTGSTNLFVDGYITLTGGSGIPADYTPKSNKTTMRWAQVFCDENDTNCTTVGNTTTGATGINAFTTLDNQSDKTGLNQANIKSTYEDIIQNSNIQSKPYDIINKNYIRVSDRNISSPRYNKEKDVTSALVYNQYLATANPNSEYYFVVWLSETGTNQTQIATDDFFGGIVTFISSGGNITGTFGNFTGVEDSNKELEHYIKDLFDNEGELTTVNIGGNTSNPTVTLNSTQGIMLDNNGEYRYYGASPKNYITFNNELWRIISVGKVYKNEMDKTGQIRMKIIREQSIGSYSWDSSASSVNNGWGVNNWPTADLNTLLNDYYYNGLDNQTCYNGSSNASTICNFSSIGLNDEAKGMIDDALWYLGGSNTTSVLTHAMYEEERGDTVYSCTTGEGCPRATTWTGKLGVMYSSDYGYATDLSKCTKNLYEYADTSCKSNDWLFNSTYQWILAPHSSTTDIVYPINPSGYVSPLYYNYGTHNYKVFSAFSVRPVLYLKSNIEIVSGEGTYQKPYILELVGE